MRLGIDLDGVCADTVGRWLELYNKEYSDCLTHANIIRWELHEFVKPECGTKLYNYLNEEKFFSGLDPIPGCTEALAELHELGHELFIVTASPRKAPTAAFDKLSWVEKHFPFFDTKNFITTHRKDMIDVEILLDDSPHNLLTFPGMACAFDQPWNQGVDAEYRVKVWAEFVALINRIDPVNIEPFIPQCECHGYASGHGPGTTVFINPKGSIIDEG